MRRRRRRQLEEQLSAYLDDELTPDQRREVEAFLAEDAAARALLEELRATIDVVGSLPRAKASDELMGALRTRLERRALLGEEPASYHRLPARTPFSGRWVATAALIAVTTVAAYVMWSFIAEEPPVASPHQQFAMRHVPTATDRDKQGSADEGRSRERHFARSRGLSEQAGEGERSSIKAESRREPELPVSGRPATPAPATVEEVAAVMELAYVDDLARRRAIETLQSDFEFEDVSSKARGPQTRWRDVSDQATELQLSVPDRQTLQRVIEQVRESQARTAAVRVLAKPADHGDAEKPVGGVVEAYGDYGGQEVARLGQPAEAAEKAGAVEKVARLGETAERRASAGDAVAMHKGAPVALPASRPADMVPNYAVGHRGEAARGYRYGEITTAPASREAWGVEATLARGRGGGAAGNAFRFGEAVVGDRPLQPNQPVAVSDHEVSATAAAEEGLFLAPMAGASKPAASRVTLRPEAPEVWYAMHVPLEPAAGVVTSQPEAAAVASQPAGPASAGLLRLYLVVKPTQEKWSGATRPAAETRPAAVQNEMD